LTNIIKKCSISDEHTFNSFIFILRSFAMQSSKVTRMKALLVIIATLTVVTAGCTGDQPPVVQQQTAAQVAMHRQVETINSCKAEGLEEATCLAVYSQMKSGNIQNYSSTASCEQQLGAGQCQTVPIMRPDGTSAGTMVVSALAGAAMGAIGYHLLKNGMSGGVATLPPSAWSQNNRPSVSAPQNPVGGVNGVNGVKIGSNIPNGDKASFADLNKNPNYKAPATPAADPAKAKAQAAAATGYTASNLPKYGAAAAAPVVPQVPQAQVAVKSVQTAPKSAYAPAPTNGYGGTAYKQAAPVVKSYSPPPAASRSTDSKK
jgi:hypothetical protein